MYKFNASEVHNFINPSKFDIPLIAMFESFMWRNDITTYNKVKKSYSNMSTSIKKNKDRQDAGKRNEKIGSIILDNAKDTQIKVSKVYNVERDNKIIEINICGSVDAVDNDDDYYEFKYRLNTLSDNVRFYEKTQLLMYCDMLDIPYIKLLEFKNKNDYKYHTQEREDITEIINALADFVIRYEDYKPVLLETYKKIKSKFDREEVIKKLLYSNQNTGNLSTKKSNNDDLFLSFVLEEI